MAKEFIIKNGLLLNDSNPINHIISGDTGLTYNENTLVSEYTIKKNIDSIKIGDLFDVDTSGVQNDYVLIYSGGTWKPADLNGLSASVTLSWNFKTSTISSDPGSKNFKFNNTTTANITKIYINDETNGGVDASSILSFIGETNKIYIQENDDSTKSYLFDVISSSIDNSGWWTINVTFISGSNDLPSSGVFSSECGFIIYSDITSELSNYTTLTQFNDHTGDTSIHFNKSDIEINDLSDINLSSLNNYDHLEYDSNNSEWINVKDMYINGNLDITGDTHITGTTYTADILPHSHLTYNIGKRGQRYDKIFARKFKAGTASTEFGDGEIICLDTTSGFTINANLGDIKLIGDVIPETDKSHNIGATDNRWSNIHVDVVSATTLYGDASNLTGLNNGVQTSLQVRYLNMGSNTGLVPFNITDLENDTTILEHNSTNTSRIDIKKIGLYRITYSFEIDAQSSADFSVIMKLNGTDIVSSNIDQHIYSGDKQNAEKSIIHDFTTTGYLEVDCVTNPGNILNILLNISKLDILTSTGGGGGTPGGNNIEIQFNDNGVFGGDSNLTWNGSQLNTSNSYISNLSAFTFTLNNHLVSDILDEDDMISNSSSALATQQSIKKYIDDKVISGKTMNVYPTVSQTYSSDTTINYSTIRAGSGVASLSSGELTMLVGGERTIIVTHSATINTNTRNTSRAKLQIDDGSGWSDITNAQCSLYHRTTADGEETGTIVATINLNVNDKIRVIAWNLDSVNTTTLPAGCSLTLISTTGSKGDKGDIGNSGDIDWSGSWSSQNYTENQTVEYLGSSYVCILDTTSSQNPSNTTYWDLVASKGDSGAGSSINIANNGSNLGSFTDMNFNSNLTVTDAGSGVAEINLDLTQEYMIPIWAEENSSLGNATYEWAFGNGANTPNDIGVTIYVPTGWNCEVKAMSLRIKSGTATVELVHNGTLQGSNCNVTVSSGQGSTNDSFASISISNNDYINFRTTTSSGTATSNVVTAWLRYYK